METVILKFFASMFLYFATNRFTSEKFPPPPPLLHPTGYMASIAGH